MEEQKITLSHPIEAFGESVTELTLGDPDLRVLDDVRLKVDTDGAMDINLGDMHKLIAGMANIPKSSARKIKLRDLKLLVPVIADFLGLAQPTGAS